MKSSQGCEVMHTHYKVFWYCFSIKVHLTVSKLVFSHNKQVICTQSVALSNRQVTLSNCYYTSERKEDDDYCQY